MKNKKIILAFTVAEMIVVLLIIGILSVLMLFTMGNKVDKNKALFKKAYSVTERTVVELVNDETYYPYVFDKFGFKEDSDVKIVGADYYTSKSNISNRTGAKKEGGINILVKFCNLFSNNINLTEEVTFSSDEKNCTFKGADGIDWKIEEATSPVNGFLITVNTDGTGKGVDMPSGIGSIESEGDTKNRDVFFMYIRYDGKMQLPSNDTVAKSYLKSFDLNREESKKANTTGTGAGTGTGTGGE